MCPQSDSPLFHFIPFYLLTKPLFYFLYETPGTCPLSKFVPVLPNLKAATYLPIEPSSNFTSQTIWKIQTEVLTLNHIL